MAVGEAQVARFDPLQAVGQGDLGGEQMIGHASGRRPGVHGDEAADGAGKSRRPGDADASLLFRQREKAGDGRAGS